MTTFHDLGLDPLLLKALDTEGYTTPTPIQAQAIPSILSGKDLLGIAQTGTGKTAAFALPILQRLSTNRQPPLRKGVRALILSPTRELATQIGESFRTYGRHLDMSVAVVFGGVAHKPQRDALARGVDVLVATPGRLIDHMTERNVVLDGTEILVLDEADQMMDLGFIRPLRQIIAKLSHRRQSLFFSATMPHEIGALAAELLKDPVKVAVTPVAKTADRVAQEVIFVEQPKKRALLVELFANPDLTRAIVFTRTKRGADRVARHLEAAGLPVAAIHGNKSQAQRDHAMRGFKAGRLRALIATDIAARGIDIDAVSHVINYEIPNVPESYVHRIGRTARAGAEGIAISLVDNEERAYLRDIERLTRQPIPAKDRRNDETLVAPVESRAERAAERADMSPGGSRGQRPRGEPQRTGGDHRRGGNSRPFDPLKSRSAAPSGGRPPFNKDRDDDRRHESRPRPNKSAGNGYRDSNGSERSRQAQGVTVHSDPFTEGRPQESRPFRRDRQDNADGHRSNHAGGRPQRDHGNRHADRHPSRDGRRPHGQSQRPDEPRSRGDRSASGRQDSRREDRGSNGGHAPAGIGGVKFLNGGKERPRSHSAAPRGDDRRKAPQGRSRDHR
ncbi:MAG: DEAD/DEAH box helicase [Hyphomicrobium sp.]|nr:DEAD/DEAH box helicase [Hyphomicrobium sp.]